jgi:peptidoglycan-associated lipoprotein
MGAVLVSVGLLLVGVGCASKQVASTSGDQSTTLKSKAGAAGDGGPVESVKQEPMTSVDPSPSAAEASTRETPPSPPATEPSAAERSFAPESSSGPSSSLVPPSGSGLADATDLAGLGDIYFDFDQYSIRGDARSVLENHARWLQSEAAGKSLVIEGHCDERGTLAYNLVLGEKRARSTKQYLEDLGVPGSRMQTVSYGEVRPFCKDHNEACWSKNRRAHFVVR